MSLRIEVKDTRSFRRPGLYNCFLLPLVLVELYQQSSVADFAVGRCW